MEQEVLKMAASQGFFAVFIIGSYARINLLSEVKHAIMTQGPVLAGVRVFESALNELLTYSTESILKASLKPGKLTGIHWAPRITVRPLAPNPATAIAMAMR